MIPIHQDLLTVLDAVEIESPSRYWLLGSSREVPDIGPTQTSPLTTPSRLASMLALDLYERLYIRRSLPPLPGADALDQRDLVAGLSAANAGFGHWEAGWTVRGLEPDGRVVVMKDALAFWAARSDVHVRDGTVRPGARCQVRVGKELRGLLPGFYVAIGGEAEPTDDGGEVVEPLGRYYWHLRPEAAVPFMATASSLLNDARLTFRVKLLNHPNAYHRADAGVLFFRRRDIVLIDAIVARVYLAIACGLRPEVPMFTERFKDGLGYAEDPPNSQSFGEHRCELVAAALWSSFIHGDTRREDRAAALAAAFVEEGLDPLRPHLGRGCESECDAEPSTSASALILVASESQKTEAAAPSSSTLPVSRSLLDAATRIGQDLCQSAYWDQGGFLCNWLGRSTAEMIDMESPITPTTAATGPDLYGGSAGIALFLALLHHFTGDDHCRRTAIGAIRRSIRQFDRSPAIAPLTPMSFFSGDLGVAYAASRVAVLTGHTEFFNQIESMLDRVAKAVSVLHMVDVIGGSAGAIPILLGLGRTPGLEYCRALAIDLGGDLCGEVARRLAPAIVSSDAAPDLEPIETIPSGLSHGAAGIGLALFELYAATGRRDFRAIARKVFEYEDTMLDMRQGNWADSHSPSVPRQFQLAWCNGAPGIVLTRLRAAILDPDSREDYLVSARLGITTTLDAIEAMLATPRCDATPCHGLMGLIEIVFIAGQVLDHPQYRDRALAATDTLIGRHSGSGDWPSGLYSGGPNPSLMLGTAGIGYTLLRLHDPERVPSILLLTR
jgi:lantibiotic biosynthesis protein